VLIDGLALIVGDSRFVSPETITQVMRTWSAWFLGPGSCFSTTHCVKLYPKLAMMIPEECVLGMSAPLVRGQLVLWSDIVHNGVVDDLSLEGFLYPRLAILTGWIVLALRMRMEREQRRAASRTTLAPPTVIVHCGGRRWGSAGCRCSRQCWRIPCFGDTVAVREAVIIHSTTWSVVCCA
jgi:hypothetical protein